MIDALIAGTLHGEATAKTANNGNRFVTCKIRTATGDGSLLANIITFSDTVAKGLLALGAGDSVAVSGSVTPKIWAPEGGPPRVVLDVQAHALLTPFHIKRKRSAMTEPQQGPTMFQMTPAPAPAGRTAPQALADFDNDVF
jgi:hypothetical protein